MAGPLILHIETATDICSVALSEGDQQLSLIESGAERSHATLLSAFIRKAFSESAREMEQIDAVAISKGPGSYTGLRIGVSTAKGLAYALEKPLVASGTLKNMAYGAGSHQEVQELIRKYGKNLLLCPMLDARRMEVYAGFYSPEISVVREVSADVIDEQSYRDLMEKHHVCFFGNGATKCEAALNHPNAHFIKGIDPSANQMILPALDRFNKKQFEDVAYFEPFYLKDFVATKPRKKVL
ncbi:MAG: tRNA (adenosine(37)-N6)-threonylcarbamoyltransferase complex dimerization subunit type 1 TsaB [Bacteroidales bacterium]|nr:tRNA (adenosine(37)-N6)-threonylcarbamoyltransferase complex dimerization subunit type 1 TsaB [Bacteroidales bacterium]